ncbi:hypothetical protein GALMADRAFT_157365 [Galerina marginata CBS 339.88]|uniref:Uncharacterized protein n=1 Tax=Galerina marginata (strain CBS 339.88) TaxID=685588 RepID=A0A067SV23_GALM3|nr:hypothetical protein GALMADRAFT_157365 [Galerina marginata CBS 339.88]
MSQQQSTALTVHRTTTSSLGRRPGSPLQGQPRLQRARGATPPDPRRPPKTTPYHLRKADIPEGASGFKAALELHLRILLGAMTNTSVPEEPDLHTIRSFEQRYTSAEEVERLLRGATEHYANADARVFEAIRQLRLRAASLHGSQIAVSIGRVPEDELRRIFSTVHSFGLPEWRPDLIGGTPTSIYNGALESIALWTFEKAMGKLAYRHLQPNLSFLRDSTLLQRLYNNFIWSYMKNLALRERKEAGSVGRDLERNKVYKERSERGARRLKQLQANGFNDRIQRLVEEPECHSDSERKDDGPGFWIMFKKARNPHITNFFRWIDDRQLQVPLVRGQRAGARQAERRDRHPNNKETEISQRVPTNVPLDWFPHDYFNSLPVDFRARFHKAPIALPLASDIPAGLDPAAADWKTMPEAEFMEKYGKKVRDMYNLPTREELRNVYGDDYVLEDDQMDNGNGQ